MSSVEVATEASPIEQQATEVAEGIMGCILTTCEILVPDALYSEVYNHALDGLRVAYDAGNGDALIEEGIIEGE